jgi:hypothetical protein
LEDVVWIKKQVGRCGLDKETGWKMWSGFIWLKMKTREKIRKMKIGSLKKRFR